MAGVAGIEPTITGPKPLRELLWRSLNPPYSVGAMNATEKV